jgi:hypothetical protein
VKYVHSLFSVIVSNHFQSVQWHIRIRMLETF